MNVERIVDWWLMFGFHPPHESDGEDMKPEPETRDFEVTDENWMHELGERTSLYMAIGEADPTSWAISVRTPWMWRG